jgi:two-component system CheB/CheR fusion protein
VGTLFVDLQLRITRFTPSATQVINLIQTDVGRPVSHIVSNLIGYDRLVPDIQAVLDNLIPIEASVQTRAGAWYLMRIRPYRSLENVIEGAVITFVDITDRKRVEEAMRDIERKYAAAFRASPDALLICRAGDGGLIEANESWERVTGFSRQEMAERAAPALDLVLDADDQSRVAALLRTQVPVRNLELRIRRKTGEARRIWLSIEPLAGGSEPHLLICMHELSDQ